jgi:hypothetical protein
VLVEHMLSKDARGGLRIFNIYTESHCKAIAYLCLCTSNRGCAKELSFHFTYIPVVCEILNSHWKMQSNAVGFRWYCVHYSASAMLAHA